MAKCQPVLRLLDDSVRAILKRLCGSFSGNYKASAAKEHPIFICRVQFDLACVSIPYLLFHRR